VNDFLSGLFLGVGIKLVDFKIEIGRIWDGDYMRLIVADEISPDSCRLWDTETGKKLDKDVFRRDLGDLADARSLASIWAPWRRSGRRTWTAAISPSRSAWMPVSIFIASMVSSRSPCFTFCPAVTATVATTPGIGAPRWLGLPASAFGRLPGLGRDLAVGHPDGAGLAVQLEEHAHLALIVGLADGCRRISSVLPGSISASISSPGSMP
jgi:hypothetical protein